MKKSLNWTWIGVAAAVIIYSIMTFADISAYFSIFGSVLQAWAIIFFACFGFNKCLNTPFKQRTLWISLACAAGFVIIMELFTSLMSALTNYAMMSESLLPTVIGSVLFSVVGLGLFVLAYMLTRLSTEGKSAFALRWNKWMLFAIIVIAAFAVYRVFMDASFAAMTLGMVNGGINILSVIAFFGNGIWTTVITTVITMVCRGAVLFFIGAAALESKLRSAI